jgi:hypothetical protein
MTSKEMIDKFIDLNEKSVLYMEKVSNVLIQLNDSNKLHHQALETNTSATHEMTKSFNRIWYVLWAVILALIVLAGAEKVLKFLPVIK